MTAAAHWPFSPVPPRPKKITQSRAARLVNAIVAIQECSDCPATLRVALEDARREISPFYDNEEGK